MSNRKRITWTVKELSNLRKMFVEEEKSCRDISRLLGMPYGVIKSTLGNHNIRRYNRVKWTAETDSYLAEVFPKIPNNEIAKRLNTTIDSVRSRAYSIGLRKVEQA